MAPATAPGGMLEGRVINPATGEYLEFVRITVDGTNLETFTDITGAYRIVGVPAGGVTVRVFRTGTPAQTRRVTIPPGGVAQQDFELSTGIAGDTTVKLQTFVVSTSTEMDGAAIAIKPSASHPTR